MQSRRSVLSMAIGEAKQTAKILDLQTDTNINTLMIQTAIARIKDLIEATPASVERLFCHLNRLEQEKYIVKVQQNVPVELDVKTYTVMRHRMHRQRIHERAYFDEVLHQANMAL